MSEKQASSAIHPLRQIISNASWLTGSQFAGDVASLVLFVILARAYGPEGIGQYAYALGIAGILYAIVNLGLEDLAVRECARTTAGERGSLIGRMLFVQTLVLLISVGLLGVYLTVVDHSTHAIELIIILVVQQVFFAFSRTLLSPAFAAQKMAPAAIARFVTRLFGIVASLVLVLLLNWSLSLSLVPLAIGGFLLFLYSIQSCLTECKGLAIAPQWQAIKNVLQQAWPFAGSLALSYLALRSSFIIINLTLGDTATGVYASAMKLMEVAVLPLGFLGFAAYPRLSSLYRNSRDEFYVAGEVLVRVAAVIGVIISWGLLYIAPYVIVPLLGTKFQDTASIVQSLAGLALLTSLSFMVVRLMLASDRHHLRLLIQAIMVAVLLATTVLTMPVLGLNGAVFGMYASVLTSVVLTVIVLGKSFNSRLWRPIVQIGIAVLLALLAAFVVESVSVSDIWPALLSIVTFFLTVFSFGVIPWHVIPIISRSA